MWCLIWPSFKTERHQFLINVPRKKTTERVKIKGDVVLKCIYRPLLVGLRSSRKPLGALSEPLLLAPFTQIMSTSCVFQLSVGDITFKTDLTSGTRFKTLFKTRAIWQHEKNHAKWAVGRPHPRRHRTAEVEVKRLVSSSSLLSVTSVQLLLLRLLQGKTMSEPPASVSQLALR